MIVMLDVNHLKRYSRGFNFSQVFCFFFVNDSFLVSENKNRRLKQQRFPGVAHCSPTSCNVSEAGGPKIIDQNQLEMVEDVLTRMNMNVSRGR